MIQLKRDTQVINAPIGYSFTTFFFGFFPVLFRGDLKMAGAMLLLGIGTLIPVLWIICLLAAMMAPAVVNRIYIARRQAEGYVGGEPVPAAVFPLQQGEAKAMGMTLVAILVLGLFFGLILVAAA